MEDLTIIGLFFANALLAALIAGAFALKCSTLNEYYKLEKKYLESLSKKDLPLYFSHLALKEEAFRKALNLKPSKILVLKRLAMKDIFKAQKLISFQIKKYPKDLSFLLLDAKISLLTQNRKRFEHIMDNIRLPRFLSKKNRAEYLYLCAENELYQTDMCSASLHISKALKVYQKKGGIFETALCYQTLGRIYRISGVFDVAFTMLKEAKKIYEKLNISAKIAETEAYFGLIEIGRENLKTAQDYLDSAAKICQQNNLEQTLAHIRNWQGLILFLNNQLKKATELFDRILEVSQSLPALSYAAEMLARIALKQKKYDSALNYANSAVLYAKKQNLAPNIFENLYLKAEIYYASNDYQNSRKILTELIKQKKPPTAIYYPANAYTLLGLVELKEENLNKARTLFKQALDMEHAQNRLKGAAIDYNNLAELSHKTGNHAEAETYLAQALKYAQQIEDEELIKYLKSKKL